MVKKLLPLILILSLIFILFSPSPIKIKAQSGVVLGPWSATAEFPGKSHPLPSFAIGQYYYVHSDSNRNLFVGKQQADGSLSGWQVALNDHGGGPHGYTAVATNTTAYHFRNGHIVQYLINGSTGMVVEFPELEGASPFSGNKYVWDTAILATFSDITDRDIFYHLGGFNFTGYGYNKTDLHRKILPINQGAEFDRVNNNVPADNPNKAAFARIPDQNYGYIFMGKRNTAELHSLRVQSDGSVGNWTKVRDLPGGSGNKLGDFFVINDSLFVIRGSKVYKAVISSDGSISDWDDSPPDLPEEQIDVTWNAGNTEGASYGIIGNYVYVTGPKKVYYAQISGNGGNNPTNTPTLTSTPPTDRPTTTPTPTTPPSTSSTYVQPINGIYPWTGGGPKVSWTDSLRHRTSVCNGKYCWRYDINTASWVDGGKPYDISVAWATQAKPINNVYLWSNGGPTSAWTDSLRQRLSICNGKYCWRFDLTTALFTDNGNPYDISVAWATAVKPLNNVYPWTNGGPTTAWSDTKNHRSTLCNGKVCWRFDMTTATWVENGTPYDISVAWGNLLQPLNNTLPWTGNGPTSAWENSLTHKMTLCNGSYCWIYDIPTGKWNPVAFDAEIIWKTSPTPSIAPCPSTSETKLTFSLYIKSIDNLDVFNQNGGLTIEAYSTSGKCGKVLSQVNLTTTQQADLYQPVTPLNLSPGTYVFTIVGPNTLKQVFQNIVVTSSTGISKQIQDCDTDSGACGDLSNAAVKNARVLYTGDANSDSVINILDYEIYRQAVSQTYNFHADFDYNGKVEFIHGDGDDLSVLIKNFGQKSTPLP